MKKGVINDVNEQSLGSLISNELLEKDKNNRINFLIRLPHKIYSVAVIDIALIYLENKVVYLLDFKGEKHPISKTLEDIGLSISPHQFNRINRQVIVNRNAIKDIVSSAST